MQSIIKICKIKWFKLPDQFRFLIIGGFNTLVAYIVFCLLVLMFGEENHQICLAAQWIITSFISFFTQKNFVFKSNGNYLKEYLKCCVTWFVGYCINVVLLEFFVRLNLNVYISQIAALGITAICNYILLKYWALIRTKIVKE